MNLFVSHEGLDPATAATIAARLRGRGHTVSSRDDLPADERWQSTLQTKLNGCDGFVMLIGPRTLGGWRCRELGPALTRHFSRSARTRLPILPVLLGDTDVAAIPSFLAAFPSVRIGADTGASDAELAALEAALAKLALESPAERRGSDIFPGLAAFTRRHQALYFGREADLIAARDALSATRSNGTPRRWLRVEGDSGVGKTSFLEASLIPAIEQGWLPLGATGSASALLGVLQPSAAPLSDLAAVIAAAGSQDATAIERRLADPSVELRHVLEDPGHTLVLVVEQLEGWLASAVDQQELRRVDALLAQALNDDTFGFALVTVLRSDALGRFSALPQLNAARRDAGLVELLPLREPALLEVAIGAVESAGFHYGDERLAADLVAEARHDAGALPLLGNLLRELASANVDGVLQRARYVELGGLRQSLAASADRAVAAGGEQQARVTAQLLLALVEALPGRVLGRRALSRQQFVAEFATVEEGRQVLDRLTGGTTGTAILRISPARSGNAADDRVELIHDILLGVDSAGHAYWPALHSRVEQLDYMSGRARLEERARRWQGNPGAAALAGRRELRSLETFRSGAEPAAVAYLDASAVHARRRRRLAAVVVAIPLLLGAVVLEGSSWLSTARGDSQTAHAAWSTVVARWRLALGWPEVPSLVALPAAGDDGCFRMGSLPGQGGPSEQPQHEACVGPFSLSQHEVTFSQYDAFALATDRQLPNDRGWGRGDQPAIGVEWADARAYAEWLSAETDGLVCTLPSEAEWELAARAGSAAAWPFGADAAALGEHAWFAGNSGGRTHPVGQKEPNAFGLHDMLGNAWEWVEDCWHDSYREAPRDGSAWLDASGGDCSARVLRGGSSDFTAEFLRPTFRIKDPPVYRNLATGFRVACRVPNDS